VDGKVEVQRDGVLGAIIRERNVQPLINRGIEEVGRDRMKEGMERRVVIMGVPDLTTPIEGQDSGR
jgi:hypothetical protein